MKPFISWSISLLGNCILLLFLSCSVTSLGQNQDEAVKSLLDSSYQVSRYDYDKCIQFVDSSQLVTGYANESYYDQLSLYYYGVCNLRHGKYEEALDFFEQGIESFATLKDTSIISDLYYQKSLVFRQQSYYKEFLENVNKSLALAEAINYSKNIGMCNNAKLIHFNDRKRFDKAEECGLKALEIFQTIQDSSSMGDVYNNLGVLMSEQSRYDKALEYHLLQHELNEKLNNVWGKGYSNSKLANIYAQQGNYSLANFHINEALKLSRELGTPYELSGTLLRSARVNATIGNYKAANRDIHESIAICKEYHLLKSLAGALSELINMHKQQSLSDSALFYSERLMTVKDSILNLSIGKQLNELEVKYDTEKKDKAILKLQYEDELNEARITQQWIIISSGLLALALLAVLFFRVKSKNQKIEEQNAIINKALKEKDILLREIHHRVKNNLQMISSLLGIQSRNVKDKIAKEAIQEGRTRVFSMSLIHQNLYQKDNLSGVPMEDYLPRLCKNLIDTYSINSDQITMTTGIEAIKLDVETVIPIGLIVNELITNAVKYAFPDERNGEILIELRETEKGLLLAVQDNGVGFSESQKEDNQDGGFGHKLITAFKSRLGADIEFIHDNGTRIELLIQTYKKM
ncbi:MAG: histidine kinase dimerization/phosphoacceptor domain -containing protein [Flavobacteriales bacterium]